jgi:serine/threonine protein phosphatase 1
MRSLAIGDIHGCRTALETLISFVNPTSDDQFIFLGDYVNRGPDSRGVIEFLLNLKNSHRCVFLRGNHEIMTLDARQERTRGSTMNLALGGELIRSYGYTGKGDWWHLIPAAHWQFIEQTARYFETNRHIFVHGALDADMDLAEQPDWIIFWERFDTIRPHKSGKKVICGHTPSRDGEIQDVGFAACIDTGAVLGRWLTCLDAETGQYWQANQKGQTRAGQRGEH